MDKPVVVNRRVFFLGVAVGVPLCSVVLASTGALAQTAATDATKAPAGASAAPALKLLPDNDATAKALGYSPDATTAKRVKRGAVEAKDQFCSSCQMYTKAGTIGTEEVGKCLMLPSGAVKAKGWCNSWVKHV